MNQERFQYCLNQLKRFDHDRYLAVLLAPEADREILAAYFAFDAEMMRIPTTVSEPMLADIRFQWWRETLEAMTPSQDPGHEIAAALSTTFFDRGLSPADLVSLIDLRARDLAEEPFPTMKELNKYHGEIADQQIALFAQIANGLRDGQTLVQLKQQLTAYGIVNQLRRLPHDIASSQLCLPLDILGEHDLDPHDLFQGTHSVALKQAVDQVLGHAEALLAQAGPIDFRNISRLIAPILPAGLTPLYIRKLGASDFDLFRQSSEIPAFRRQIRYLRINWTKKI
eukprot:s1_g1924.t1